MITIYGKENCRWCELSKQLLTDKDIPYTYLILGVDYSEQELIDNTLIKEYTFPQITYDNNNKYIGGYQNLVFYLESKELLRNASL